MEDLVAGNQGHLALIGAKDYAAIGCHESFSKWQAAKKLRRCAYRILSNQSKRFGDGAGSFLSGLEVFDGGLAVVLQGDEPLGL